MTPQEQLENLERTQALVNAQAETIQRLQRELVARDHKVPVESVIGTTEEEMRASMKKRDEDQAKSAGEDFAKRNGWVETQPASDKSGTDTDISWLGADQVVWP